MDYPEFTFPCSILLPKIKEIPKNLKFNKSLLNRVYVGNLSPEIRKIDLKRIFEEYGFIKSISLNMDPVSKKCKGYAFVEFDNPHAASLSISKINNRKVMGKLLRLNKPVNYPRDIPDELLKVDPTLLYVSNIHYSITEYDIKRIFTHLDDCSVYLVYKNTIMSGNHVSDNEKECIHMGYGYIKFSHHSFIKEVLNLEIKLGGKELKFGPTVFYQELPKKREIKIDPELKKIINEIEKEIGLIENRDNCLILKNLIDFNELDTDFVNELYNELKKYGEIEDFCVKVNRNLLFDIEFVVVNRNQNEDVIVYVIYKDYLSFENAKNILENRYFGGRRIHVKSCKLETLSDKK